MHVKKGDNVLVIAGKDKGKKGLVTKAMPQENRIVVEGVHVQKRHQKARKGGKKGQIIDIATPIHVSNVKKA